MSDEKRSSADEAKIKAAEEIFNRVNSEETLKTERKKNMDEFGVKVGTNEIVKRKYHKETKEVKGGKSKNSGKLKIKKEDEELRTGLKIQEDMRQSSRYLGSFVLRDKSKSSTGLVSVPYKPPSSWERK